MVEPHSSNFRVITTNSLGVRIFRKFTVCRDGSRGSREGFLESWTRNISSSWMCSVQIKIVIFLNGPRHEQTCLCHMRTTYAHPRSLISIFVVRCLDVLTWSQTPKTGFLMTRLKWYYPTRNPFLKSCMMNAFIISVCSCDQVSKTWVS